jgi:hypothetical protein
MVQRVSIVVVIGTMIASASAFGGCPSPPIKAKTHAAKVRTPANDCVDFGMVPQVSQQIVASEHIATPAKPSPDREPANQPYTGPTVGTAAAGVRPAPTIGYKWSLD